ncbi:hypothetical protein AS202_14640 [Myroides odoratimimus]|uniref:Uncharacterized protein n=2 Tax=Myroides odoratimimus TaxID=76832 RepID=A0AAI8C7C1_9FLAO|nr:hypothetical protein AS202_14640 [Myroides odoratimimus]
MSYDSGFKDPFRDEFNLSINFINNYISKKIQLLNLDTTEDFNTIHIEPTFMNVGVNKKVAGSKTIKISLYFDKEYYMSIGEVDKIEYCLKLVYDGCEQLFKTNNFLLLELNNIFITFKEAGYINRLLYKTKKFKDNKLEVKLYRDFTSTSLSLNLIVVNLENKEVLLNDILIKTLPDELCFNPLFKDIILLNNQLIITEFQNRPKFIFELGDVLQKEFKFKVTEFGLTYRLEMM